MVCWEDLLSWVVVMGWGRCVVVCVVSLCFVVLGGEGKGGRGGFVWLR